MTEGQGKGVQFMGYSIGIAVLIPLALVALIIVGCIGMCLIGGVGEALNPTPVPSYTPWSPEPS